MSNRGTLPHGHRRLQFFLVDLQVKPAFDKIGYGFSYTFRSERRTQAGGVLVLKQFLQYAYTNINNAQANLSTKDSDVVVRQISDALSAAGLIVHTHVGASALRVDITVSRPELPDDYDLGIICDGRAYLRMRTVADREIVMPSVLTHLGWHLLRVWTIDWFEHPDTVIQQILKVL